MTTKITIQDAQKAWHTFRGDNLKLFTYPEYRVAEVIQYDADEDGNTRRRITGSFVDYILAKEGEDKTTAPSIYAKNYPPKNLPSRDISENPKPQDMDPFTTAALAARDGKEQATTNTPAENQTPATDDPGAKEAVHEITRCASCGGTGLLENLDGDIAECPDCHKP